MTKFRRIITEEKVTARVFPCQNITMTIEISQSFINRDILVLAASLLGVACYFSVRSSGALRRKRPIGRRAEDFDKRFYFRNSTRYEDEVVKWSPSKPQSYSLTQVTTPLVWHIDLFSAHENHMSGTFFKGASSFFQLSFERAQADKILAPIIRKAVAKYRSLFAADGTIEVLRKESSEPLLTYLSNESQIRAALFKFVDEISEISENVGIAPHVKIYWDDVFAMTVRWRTHPFLETIAHMDELPPEVQVSTTDSTVEMTLWLAFSQNKIPGRLAQGRTDMSRVKTA